MANLAAIRRTHNLMIGAWHSCDGGVNLSAEFVSTSWRSRAARRLSRSA
ncbi:MAG TPA: hypothetical protein VGA61_11255 [Anaerolineae bacterium]